MVFNISKIESLLVAIFVDNNSHHLHELLCEVAMCDSSFTQQIMLQDDRVIKIKVLTYSDGVRCEICNGNDIPMVFYLE